MIKKKYIIITFVLILSTLITYFIILSKGKAIVVAGLERHLHRKVELDSLRLSFFLGLHIKNLEIENLVYVDDLFIRPSLLSFFVGRPAFDEIKLVSPQFRIERLSDGSFSVSDLFSKKESDSLKQILLTKLVVKDGEIIWVDKKISDTGFVMKVEDIDIKIGKVSFPPTSLVTNFSLEALVPGRKEQPKSRFTFRGWINFLNKDMKAGLKLEGFDLVYISPYIEKYGLSYMESGCLDFTSDIEAKNNDLVAQCRLNADNLKFKSQRSEGSLISQPSTIGLLNFLKGPGEKIAINFTIRTKLNNPRINFSQFANEVGTAAAEKVITSGVRTVIEKIRDVPVESKETEESLEDKLKQGLKGLFKLETQ